MSHFKANNVDNRLLIHFIYTISVYMIVKLNNRLYVANKFYIMNVYTLKKNSTKVKCIHTFIKGKKLYLVVICITKLIIKNFMVEPITSEYLRSIASDPIRSARPY